MKKEKQYQAEYETRLSIVNRIKNGEDPAHIAQQLGYDKTTVARWVKDYDEKGRESLRAPFRPRAKHPPLDANAIRAAMEGQPVRTSVKLSRLLQLAMGTPLGEVAEYFGVSPQIIMRDRTAWREGRLPPRESE